MPESARINQTCWMGQDLDTSASTLTADHHPSRSDRATIEDSPMQLPLHTTDTGPAVEAPAVTSAVDAFRMLADFQDVIDSAADAGLIDDEAAVVFHRQLIAWSRASASSAAPSSTDTVIAAAELRAADILDDAREAAEAEVAQIRSLTLTECDEILAAARAAAARLVDDAMATALG